MRYLTILLVFFSLLTEGAQNHYLFAYFTDNGQDGLHLAYSKDGIEWKVLNGGKSFLIPTVGQDKLMRDPCILMGKDGLFHMVWTCSWKERQIGYASSKDLINWSEQKSIPVMDHEATAKNCWAPEIVYDEKNKEYIIFWATTIPERHSEIAYSAKETGLNHRIYAVSTKEFKDFSPTRLFFNPDFSVIDATILHWKHNYYMFLKNENPNPSEKNIRVTVSKNAGGPFPVLVSAPITGNYWAEGPSALTVGKYVYVYFDKYTEHKYGVIRSKDLRVWEDISGQLKFPIGARHGTAFKVSNEVINKVSQLK